MRFEHNQRVKYVKDYGTELVTYKGRVLKDNGTELVIKRQHNFQSPWLNSVDNVPKFKVHLVDETIVN